MLYTKEALREPLTTLPSIDLQRKAAELFKVNLSSWQLKERKKNPLAFVQRLANLRKNPSQIKR